MRDIFKKKLRIITFWHKLNVKAKRENKAQHLAMVCVPEWYPYQKEMSIEDKVFCLNADEALCVLHPLVSDSTVYCLILFPGSMSNYSHVKSCFPLSFLIVPVALAPLVGRGRPTKKCGNWLIWMCHKHSSIELCCILYESLIKAHIVQPKI